MKISTKIQELIEIKICEEIKFLNDDFTINWNQIDLIFTKIDLKNLDNFKECLQLKQLIDPVITCSRVILSNKDTFKSSINKFSSWTNSTDKLLKIFHDFCEDPEEYALAGFLQLISIIEFSLGSVYKSITRQPPPHLLKDVIEELSTVSCFEFNQIFLLQILVGTSKGVNLRNLSWHGFLESLAPEYLTFLLVITISYGKQLERKLIIFSRHQDELDLSISLNLSKNFEQLTNFESIKSCNLNSWKVILKYYESDNCVPGIFLILSQLEGLLRKMFGEVNEADVTAQLNKYYVIMDSIYYGYVLGSNVTPLMIGKITKVQEMEIRKTCKRNRMLEVFPRSQILLFHDLFYAVDGPRIRDKISHGEVKIGDGNSKTVLKTLLQFTWLTVKFYDQKQVPENFHYKSIFMTSFQFARNFNSCNEKFKELFNNFEIPKDLTRNKIEIMYLKVNLNDIKILFLPLVEAQVTKLLLNILENFNKALDNFQSSTRELFELFNQRKLSSGRRDMLKNLIESLPNLAHGLESMLHILHKIFFIVQDLDDKFENENWSNKIIKLLKKILKLNENLVRYFSTQHRNYFVANQKICKYLELTKECDSWLCKFNKIT